MNVPGVCPPDGASVGSEPSAAVLADLVARVEKLEMPDRELDREILGLLCERAGWKWTTTGPDINGENNSTVLAPPDLPKGFSYPPKGPISPLYHVPRDPITASIDAAVAVVQRELGGGIALMMGAVTEASLWPFKPRISICERHRTAPLAICLALLRALQNAQPNDARPQEAQSPTHGDDL